MTLTAIPHPLRIAAALAPLLLALAACSTGHQIKDGKVYYKTWNEFHGTVRLPIPEADVASFQILNKRYGKDRHSAYYTDGKIVGSDPATFLALSDSYAKDKGQVYYENKPFTIADPESFESLGYGYGRDKKDVYLLARPIHACDPASFRWIGEYWQVDALCAYYSGVLVKGADQKTLTEINSTFAKDRHNVYSSISRAIVEGADPQTFRAHGRYGRDKNGCYKGDRRASCSAP